MRKLARAVVLPMAGVLVAAAGSRAAGAQTRYAENGRTLRSASSDNASVAGPEGGPLARRVSLTLRDVPLVRAVETVAQRAGIHLTYSSDDFPASRRVTLSASHITADSAFRAVLAETHLRVLLTSGASAVVTRIDARPTGLHQSDGTVVARIVEISTDAPLANALVALEGTDLRGVTAATGLATIDHVPAGQYVVTARVLGYREGRSGTISVLADSTARVTVRLTASPAVLEHVQVTATKSPESVVNVPAMTTTIGPQEIADQGAGRFTQVLNNVPGLINSALETQFESVMLRGMPREGNEWTNTLLMIDGIPQTDSRNSARVINLPLENVNRVEVVEGPNSALYGRTAVGGVVNVLTPDPTADPRFDLDLQGGQFDQFGVKAAASGPIKDWGGYYVSADENQNHAYYLQPYTFTIKSNALFAKFAFSPDRQSQGMISVNQVVSDNALPTPLPIINGRLLSDLDPAINLYQNFNLPSSNYHQEETRATFNYERELNPWLAGTTVFGYRHIVYQFQNDGDGVGSPFDTVAKTFTQYPFAETYAENIYYSELRFALHPRIGSLNNELMIGTSYDYTTGYGSGVVLYTDTTTFGWTISYANPQNPGFPPQNTWQYLPYGGNSYNLGILGAYAQYRLDPVRRLSLVVAGRYDDAYLSNTPTTAPGTTPRVSSRWNAFSPKASATVRLIGADSSIVRPGLRLNAYATYSTAFVPPRTPSALNQQDSLNLSPQYVQNYEGGFKGDAAAGRISFQTGYFFMREDGIVVDTRVGPFYYPSNAGVENFQGFEGALQWSPNSALALYGNVAWYHDRYGHFVIQQSGGNTVLTGNRMPISPDNIENLGGTWRFWRAFGLQANMKHVGSTYLDQGDTFLLPPYVVVDASVFWRHRIVQVTLSVHNLLDDRYFTMGDIELAQSVDPSAPRQILLTTSFHLR